MSNLEKKYNELLDLNTDEEETVKKELYPIFERDFAYNENLFFRGKKVKYCDESEWGLDIAFRHLITIKINKERKRAIDLERCKRLHWLKYLLDGNELDKIVVFSLAENSRIITYIWDKAENYVIVLEDRQTHYFLLSAYYLFGRNVVKMERKLSKKLPKVY